MNLFVSMFLFLLSNLMSGWPSGKGSSPSRMGMNLPSEGAALTPACMFTGTWDSHLSPPFSHRSLASRPKQSAVALTCTAITHTTQFCSVPTFRHPGDGEERQTRRQGEKRHRPGHGPSRPLGSALDAESSCNREVVMWRAVQARVSLHGPWSIPKTRGTGDEGAPDEGSSEGRQATCKPTSPPQTLTTAFASIIHC